MQQNLKNEELAYWIGLLQADGSLKRCGCRKNKKVYEMLTLELDVKDKVLVENFQKICKKFLKRNPKIFYRTRGTWTCHIGVKRLQHLFKELDIHFSDPPIPPKWCIGSQRFFGAYLAGVIDGDGDIRIKRKKYPQCVIRIVSGTEQNKLAESIRRLLKCAVSITKRYRVSFFQRERRFISGVSFDLEFLVSSKNFIFIKNHVLPRINLPRKSTKLKEYIAKRWVEQDLNLRFPPRQGGVIRLQINRTRPSTLF